MGRQNKLKRNLLGILKDKASLIRAALSIKRATSSLHVAVLQATTHSSTSPPPEHRVATVLSLGHGSRVSAGAIIGLIMDRLHNTHDDYVALKCLITLHRIITGGSFILKDQLSFYPSTGGRNFLNLSRFRDRRDPETWELSSWVRWYASVLEFNLMASRVLGVYISSSTKIDDFDKQRATVGSSSNTDLMKEIDVLVGLVEEMCRSPDSLHYQKNNLVYEVSNLVGEDYRSTQHHVLARLTEFNDRINGLSAGELAELACVLKRLEDCRERLLVLFANRKRNDAFWDFVRQTKVKFVEVEEEGREKQRLQLVNVRTREKDASESTRIAGTSQLLRLPYGSAWRAVHQLNVIVRPAMA